jgi:hypothetical protein
VTAKWRHSFGKAFRWGSFVCAHALVALVLIVAILGIQELLIWVGDPKLFDRVPLRYVFDLMDVGILVTFLFFGTLEGVRVFRENDHESDD